MRHFFSNLRFLLAGLSIVYLQCSNMTSSGTIETTNGIVAGIVVFPSGSPATQTQVKIFPADYDPVKDTLTVPTDTTDTMGNYAFSNINTGDYIIQAIQLDNRTGAFITGIHVEDDTVAAPACTLQALGTMKVRIPDSVNSATGYFYLPGTTVFAFLKNCIDFVIMDSVPVGVFKAIYYSTTNTPETSIIRYGVYIEPGDTTVVYNPSWKYTHRLVLNTSSSGAAVTGNVVNFPVLIRLSPGNFDFSQAQTGGKDLQFTKPDNTFLPYEIERWDSANSQAEIWVKVDTVYGSDSEQSIFMYWGNPDVADNSNSAAVFDTADGFIGVWHMNEDHSEDSGSINDRTANEYNATPYGSMSAANSVNGIVGKALAFDGVNDYLNAGNVSLPENYSIGLWVLLDTLGKAHRFIFKDSSYTLWYDLFNASIRMEHMSNTEMWRGFFQDGGTTVPMTKGTWCYLTGTFDGTAIRLYKNGVEVSTSDVISEIPVNNEKSLLLGRAWNIDFFNGIMDEMRIEGTARSADWIRLCYMNQMENDKLVVYNS